MVINIRAEVLEDINDPIVLHVAHFEKIKGEYLHHANVSVSACNVMGRFRNHPILKFVLSQLMKSSNIPTSCPIPKGIYFVKDFTVSDELLPPFIPTGSFMSTARLVRIVDDEEVPGIKIRVYLDIENTNAAREQKFNGFSALKLFQK